MLRIIAILFGIGFIFFGVGGFLPSFYINNLLLGFFQVNTIHNLFYIISGVLAIMAATSYYYSRLFFQILGVVYAILAILGFVFSGDLSFMMLTMNTADNILHLVIALIALYLGFYTQKKLA